jgi:ribonuclease D
MAMFRPNIEKDDLKRLPLGTFDGEIHLIDSVRGLKKYLPVLMKEEVLGFDTETRPSFKKGRVNPISLLQLSTGFHAFLFRIAPLGITDELIRLFEDPGIIKVGAAVHDDIIDLQRVRPFTPENFLDLQKYVAAFGIESKGLNKLAGIVLGFRISKAQQVSNWEADPLSEAQKRYAATDAWVCYRIYRELQSQVKSS